MILKDISKKYGEKVIYENLNLEIEEGKILTILGESGEGKTTLINTILGLTDFSGEIKYKNSVSVVFQENRLVPNLTVEENLKLVDKNFDVKSALEMVNLTGVENMLPKNLSAGMLRRVAIARGLGYSAKTLILDEPFINIDIKNKFKIIEEIKRINKEKGETVICVTHDIKEAVTLADRIVIIKAGQIVYDNKKITPATESEIYNFLMK